MAKIIFIGVPAHGHTNPSLPVVNELVARGHNIIYYNTGEFRPQIEGTGVTFRTYPSPMPDSAELSKIAGNLADVSVYLIKLSQRLVPFMLEEIEREQPELLLFDSIALWGMMCARITGIPSVSSITTFVAEGVKWDFTWRQLLHILGSALPRLPQIIHGRLQLTRAHGRHSLPSVLFPAVGDLNIVYTSRYFQPESTFVDERFRFVGPSINAATRSGDFPFEHLQDKKCVYISFGTMYNRRLDFYQQCFSAFGKREEQFILSIGEGTAIEELGAIPENFIVRNRVPQLDILQHVDAFITHAGMNSVNESLYYGVPMVAIPQQFEQFINAREVERHGAGIMLGEQPPFGRVPVGELQTALTTVLNENRYQQAARVIGDSFREAGGYVQAVQEIEGFYQQIIEPNTENSEQPVYSRL